MKPVWLEWLLLGSAAATIAFAVVSFGILEVPDRALIPVFSIATKLDVAAYLLTFGLCLYYFFATPYVTEFRIGWLLLIFAGFIMAFLPFLVFPYWYFAIRKYRAVVAQQAVPADVARPAGERRG